MTKTGQISRSARKNVTAAALMLCGVLLTCSSAGTMAYLTASDSDANVLSFRQVLVELAETDTQVDSDDNPATNEYRMLPASAVAKDPMVTVPSGSAESWVFVRIAESADLRDYVSYELADGWKQLEDADGQPVPGVFYRQVGALDVNQSFPVLAGNRVAVVADENALRALAEAGPAEQPTLTISGYAIQLAGFEEPISAWEALEEDA